MSIFLISLASASIYNITAGESINIILEEEYDYYSIIGNSTEIDLDVDYYYYWLEPIGRYEKVYWQIKTVSYADYKIGFYYISPDYLKPFTGIELF